MTAFYNYNILNKTLVITTNNTNAAIDLTVTQVATQLRFSLSGGGTFTTQMGSDPADFTMGASIIGIEIANIANQFSINNTTITTDVTDIIFNATTFSTAMFTILIGKGQILFNAVNITATSLMDINTYQNIVVDNGSLLTATGAAPLNLTANMQTPKTNGNFTGILIRNGSKVTGSTTGNLRLEATGGLSTSDFNNGIAIRNVGTMITSTGGTLEIKGNGGGSGNSNGNNGVLVDDFSEVTAGLTGSLLITGLAGINTTGQSNNGVQISDQSIITSSGGQINITGTGGTGTNNNRGISIGNATVTSGLNGKVTLIGNGGINAIGSTNHGISITTGALVTSTNGDVEVIGIGGGTGPNSDRNHGVNILGTFGTTQLSAGMNGNLNIKGIGGLNAGSVTNRGISVFGGTITSGGGNVYLEGIGGGTGVSDSNIGIQVSDFFGTPGEISVQSPGNLTLIGQGGITNGDNNFGVVVGDPIFGSGTGPCSIKSNGSDIHINGTGGGTSAVTSTNNIGVVVQSAGIIEIIGNGNLNITGVATSSNSGILQIDTSQLRSTNGNITLYGLNGYSPKSTGPDVVMGNVARRFTLGPRFNIEIGGPLVDVDYDQLNIGTGLVDLNTAQLSIRLTNSYNVTLGEQFTIINNTGPNPIVGRFRNLPEGAALNVGNKYFRITYFGGTGNDVVLTAIDRPKFRLPFNRC